MSLLRLLSYVWRHPLNADGRLRAVGRVIRWQMASRLLAGPIALPFVDDTSLFGARGMTGATGNWYCGLHESGEMGFILHFLRPGDLFLDIGANIGSYTILAAGAVGAEVISVEPIPRTHASLRRNVALNGLDERVAAHCLGLSNANSSLRFTSDRDTVNRVMVDGEVGESVTVPVTTMDELLAGRIPVAIKIDVEGHEQAVLDGARATLSNPGVAAVVLEINGSGATFGLSDDALLEAMRGYGYQPRAYDPLARRLRDWSGEAGNAIFIRDIGFVESRIAQSRRYQLCNRSI